MSRTIKILGIIIPFVVQRFLGLERAVMTKTNATAMLVDEGVAMTERRENFIDGADDMMADIDRLDHVNRNMIDPVQKDMIVMLFTRYDFSEQDVADHLAIEIDSVREVLADRGYTAYSPI
ncbi:hypothetical protein FY140_17105 [Agrobacterium tumefaciens]|uniref:hypothetical protein n=1 Tax=Agrobacterium tumefaciens TaxID=358 RepID=UPI00157317CD|nr:hypothetical protein [Agrobacterium tumefaciens]UXS39488.1 hypothetical protein FY150_07115 [Agrobacterium tumefaciens]UXT22441.1 hypothetical protein FY140_17105 [Agrobacterium tumefaciens]WHO22671.1 hypothetical protein G6L90_06840 [Agrobacterium tumefaciens]